MNAWGSEYLHVGWGPWHARIGVLQRFALVVGRTGRKGCSVWVIGAAYDQEEATLLIGIPGISLALVFS